MRESITILHPNSIGAGRALEVYRISEVPTDIMFRIFPQKESDDEYPNYNAECSVGFTADWRNLSEILMVFRGECESLGDGRGISYTSDHGWSKLMLRHVIEPVHCYMLEIYESRSDVERHWDFQLSVTEALGLSLIIEGVLHHTLIGEANHEQV